MAGGAVGAFAMPCLVLSSALGNTGSVAPSERITMGCIGVGGKRPGGQGTGDLQGIPGRNEVHLSYVTINSSNCRKGVTV